MKLFNKKEFVDWALMNDAERNLSESDYQLLFNYAEGHGYALCVDAENNLYRVDVDDDGTVLYSVDELINDVSSWNRNMIQEYEHSIKVLEIAEPNVKTITEKVELLKEQEKILDKLFLTTKLGMMIKNACEKLAEEGV